MVRASLSTRTGDKGKTGLFGGKRVSKAETRLHAYGTVDELNAILGCILADSNLPAHLSEGILSIQRTLFCIGSDLATPLDSPATVDRVRSHSTTSLEKRSVALEEDLSPLTNFLLPGGSALAALFHHARTVCRRAERWIVALSEQEDINPEVIVYINRLSDHLFLAARFTNKHLGTCEVIWNGEPN
ncbi:ATP:cob(I)alamin adenosyltransferase [Candidatus Peregrinibacteria bacterium CG10_big_fil_rev_8_21_14_0_10_49_24]|nr:MAG: ATP:cob(I)alamin adenosyltransferase [Candidatus Peregrinibacteria bacterium CG11_big_fil_rev_8_21_14_0_20_49_14]PIR51510.1 MAG: ATP:cob(I)alamin adenosyltransferase [Candidatus Peregrinibacteria bacterium CG10_big_fil_rev_8_21_14_0_10_49_24]PJA67847.1 MAG: ATP:cob(I)alamin adenosyltransferase [Candidatus Peregrinibacteria bacterium CG_4_9_14_3_um_filter_49_12]